MQRVQEQYYAARATEYETTSSYLRPEHAAVMAPVRARYQLALRGHDVLEVACGPGHWTEAVSMTARSVLATDVNANLVEIVGARLAGAGNVRCQVADAYTLAGVTGPFTAAFAQFWWSHIPTRRQAEFLHALHSKLVPGALVMFMDSLPYYVRGGRRLDAEGDLLEGRTLLNGERFEVIKNFPRRAELQQLLSGIADDTAYKEFAADGYWTLKYRTRAASSA